MNEETNGHINVLVACEYSGVVRDAFRKLGFNAWSLDMLPTDADPEYHIQAKIEDYVDIYGWNTLRGKPIDLLIAHPPCTYLANSGVRWLYEKDEEGNQRINNDRWLDMEEAARFFQFFLDADVPHIAVENPVMHGHTGIRKHDQTIQPYWFGEDASKRTCLWLKGLPELKGTGYLPPGENGKYGNQTPSGQNNLGPSKDRWKIRSTTYQGIAEAMAKQWGEHVHAMKVWES